METTTLSDLKNPQPNEMRMPAIAPGFGSLQSFELMQRAAKLLSSSTLVPIDYRAFDEKKGENKNAMANCVVALNMSQRMGADPLMVMQNLYIVEGRPSWSSQWIIAAINGCGRFSPLRFELKELGKKTVEYTVFEWVDKKRTARTAKAEIVDMECVAWALEKDTGEKITSPKVSIGMAVKEGWYGKNGSKWQTMPEIMLRYRTASFFGKLYAPELLMGLQTVEEMQDIQVIDATRDGSGNYSVDVGSLKTETRANKAKNVDVETGEIVDANQVDDSNKPDEKPSKPEARNDSSQASPGAGATETKKDETKPVDIKSDDPTPEEQEKIRQQFIREAAADRESEADHNSSYNLE